VPFEASDKVRILSNPDPRLASLRHQSATKLWRVLDSVLPLLGRHQLDPGGEDAVLWCPGGQPLEIALAAEVQRANPLYQDGFVLVLTSRAGNLRQGGRAAAGLATLVRRTRRRRTSRLRYLDPPAPAHHLLRPRRYPEMFVGAWPAFQTRSR